MVCIPWWQNELPFLHCPAALYAAPTLIQMCQHNCLWDHFMDQIRQICVEKQTNKQKTRTKAFFSWCFSFCPGLYQGSEAQSVPQTIALPPSRRQQTAAEGQQLVQDGAEELPKAVLSAKIIFNCPKILFLDSIISEFNSKIDIHPISL